MGRHNAEYLLKNLAENNETRVALLATREARRGTRYLSRTCPACGEHNYSPRGKDDICDDCLIDLWSHHDAAASAVSAQAGEGITAYQSVTPDRAHDYPYPHLAGSHRHIPDGAVFNIAERNDSPARNLQQIYAEIFDAFVKTSPAPVNLKPEIFLAARSTWANSNHGALMPTRVAELLLALWSFVIWVSQDSYAAGLDEGADILRNLNEGNLSELAFIEELNEKRGKLKRSAIEAAGGGKGTF